MLTHMFSISQHVLYVKGIKTASFTFDQTVAIDYTLLHVASIPDNRASEVKWGESMLSKLNVLRLMDLKIDS